jgi:hypothetical protein
MQVIKVDTSILCASIEWANYLALERPLQAARNGRGGSLGPTFLKTFISGFSSGQQFKSCNRVHSESYVIVLFMFRFTDKECYIKTSV